MCKWSKIITKVLIIMVCFYSFSINGAETRADWAGKFPDGCTSVTVGKKASASNSVTTSHTCDSHRTRSWLDIASARTYPPGTRDTMEKRVNYDSLAMPTYRQELIGTIPQADTTYKFIDTAYPCMNEHQLAIGESTFGGRESLRAEESGLIDCQQLVHLMIERCKTAREAIKLAGRLTKKYGYNDAGECLTIADTKEVWHFEIVGPGKGNKGAVWVAQRVPDGHVSVVANGSRIRKIDLDKPDYFMASENVYQVAQDSGWWNPEEGEFEFCYAYSPESRESMSTRRREWRAFDLVAPSLELHPNSENYPFSVKPDTLVTREKLVQIFQDYYQGTRFDVWANLTQVNEDGETIVSPFSNPFMPYEMNRLFNINGGWGWRGERQIARWYTMYATITQSRESLPDEIGGLVWLALDNVATSVYIPVYSCVTDLPESYKTPGRPNGFTRKSAWWAFNRLGTLTAQRFRDMINDVQPEWDKIQTEMFARQKNIEARALELYKKDPDKAVKFLTDYTNRMGEKVVEKAWEMGDMLWTKYDEKF